MTNYTPAQARELATRLQDPQDHYEADSPAALNAILLSLCQDAANDLRFLADQLERLTAERHVLAAVVASYERVGIVAHDGMTANVGWTKSVRHNTMLFAVKEPK